MKNSRREPGSRSRERRLRSWAYAVQLPAAVQGLKRLSDLALRVSRQKPGWRSAQGVLAPLGSISDGPESEASEPRAAGVAAADLRNTRAFAAGCRAWIECLGLTDIASQNGQQGNSEGPQCVAKRKQRGARRERFLDR